MSTRIGTLSRAIAIDALNHVLSRRQHADVVLERLFNHHAGELRPLDRAFIFEIVYGSLRWLSKMDWIMSHMVDRPFTSLDPRVACALRVGAYQIFYMDRVPDRAAVSETVEAVKKVGAGNASSFVNAILRRVARKAEYYPKPDRENQTVEYLSVQYAHPQWMVERWLRHVPLERLEHLLSGNNKAPPIVLRRLLNKPLPENEDLATYLLRTQGVASEWLPLKTALKVERLPDVSRCEAFARGHYLVQDAAAQLAVQLATPQVSGKVLDACSAPGGKSIALWDQGVAAENLVLAESSRKRMGILQENLTRVGLAPAEILQGDVLTQIEGRSFDTVVLDAPCSALGVTRRHPEIKWHRTPADIDHCALEQRRLLDGLSTAVRPGGELIYIVCSAELEETTLQKDEFLKRHPNFQVVSLEQRIHDYYRRYVTRENELLILPGNSDDLDGFYAVALRKSEG
ncbi:16S rRNA (cytosine(967)-C(5))-methyltransferase [bacterium]|nr:16S rRNA (cytosine(967)-C(5))-methyltransferase [bacterium]